jgi:hypothetical protein
MTADILLEGQTIPITGVLTLHIDQQVEINISAQEAQRKVNRFVHLEISTQMHAEIPTLVVGNKAMWRCPVHLTFPSLGDVGCVGALQVNPTTGELEVSPVLIKEIEANADQLAARFAFSAA